MLKLKLINMEYWFLKISQKKHSVFFTKPWYVTFTPDMISLIALIYVTIGNFLVQI